MRIRGPDRETHSIVARTKAGHLGLRPEIKLDVTRGAAGEGGARRVAFLPLPEHHSSHNGIA